MTDPTFDTPSQQQAADSSLGQLVGEVTRDLSTLMRKELELAKVELKDSAKKAGAGAGMFAGAAYGAMMAILFLSIALWWALGYLMGNAWAAVIVAILWAVIGAILFAVGRSQVKKVRGAPQTVETIKEIPETLKRNEENR
ncbi:hypothetical protein ASD56_06735 [Microbacterium sp. Root166]|uniref:phage holin family protein n=1 Tax=Microbacterium sp. Root166 TaxID=1736478 RepID=UPI0006FEF34C|nr:phage holin family protein [Microbacterium sp. Root166]KQZ85962.1 hypothetical protein ASD56_06735 [Microbacterium sp. Root166]